MTVPSWPPGVPDSPRIETASTAARDDRAAFAPDVGEPIMRRRTTAAVREMTASFGPMEQPQRAAFEAWVEDDLRGATRAFAWRDPADGLPYRWRIAPGDQTRGWQSVAGRLHGLTLTLLRLPGVPWWRAYVLTGRHDVPVAVADYDRGVYGVDGETTAPDKLPAVTGTVELHTTANTGAVTITQTDLAAGDIPATRPRDVARIVAYRRWGADQAWLGTYSVAGIGTLAGDLDRAVNTTYPEQRL